MSIYFASDFHLGLDHPLPSKEREKVILRWLDSIQDDLEELYILGDIFDYWFEYKKVVPKGFVRLLAQLAGLAERGIDVHIFTGNHDLWMKDYLEEEIGAKVYKDPIYKKIGEHQFHLGHGDGLGPGDHGYKFLKKVFRNKINQWLFARIHPNTGIRIMQYASQRSRKREETSAPFLGSENEWLIQYAEEILTNKKVDYFLFGHRHLPIDYTLSNGHSRYINTGDWINHYSYARYRNGDMQLLHYDAQKKI